MSFRAQRGIFAGSPKCCRRTLAAALAGEDVSLPLDMTKGRSLSLVIPGPFDKLRSAAETPDP